MTAVQFNYDINIYCCQAVTPFLKCWFIFGVVLVFQIVGKAKKKLLAKKEGAWVEATWGPSPGSFFAHSFVSFPNYLGVCNRLNKKKTKNKSLFKKKHCNCLTTRLNVNFNIYSYFLVKRV